MLDPKRIGNFICEQRKNKGLTQKQLADKLFLTDKAVSKWENGECFPDITVIAELTKIFGCTADEILAGERTSPENRIQSGIERVAAKPGRAARIKSKINRHRKLFSVLLAAILVLIITIPILISVFCVKTYALGERIKTENSYFTVVSASYRKNYDSLTAGEGFLLLLIEIKMENRSKNPITVYQEDFIYSNKHTSEGKLIFINEYNENFCIIMVNIKPGQSRKGFLIYEVPEDVTYGKLVYFETVLPERMTGNASLEREKGKHYTIKLPQR